jgi:hypothetical protein
MPDLTLHKMKQSIRKYFGFLFGAGYQFYSEEYFPKHFGNWEITMASGRQLIKFYCDRNAIMIAVGRGDLASTWYALPIVIYFATNGSKLVGQYRGDLRDADAQFRRLAEVMKTYLWDVETVVHNLEQNKDALEAASEKVLDAYMEEYERTKPDGDLAKYLPWNKKK